MASSHLALRRFFVVDADRRATEIAAIEPLDLLVVSGLPRSGSPYSCRSGSRP